MPNNMFTYALLIFVALQIYVKYKEMTQEQLLLLADPHPKAKDTNTINYCQKMFNK